MIRTKGEAGTGNIVEAVRHMRTVQDAIRKLANTPQEELMAFAKEIGAPFILIEEVHNTGKLPVVNFAAGGVATPADAALMMQLGAEGVFVGSGIFKSSDPAARAEAIVKRQHTITTRRYSLRFLKTWARRCLATISDYLNRRNC